LVVLEGKEVSRKARGFLTSFEITGLIVFVEEVESYYERTKSMGAKIVEELHETEYGDYQYGVEDLEGYR
jgi:uncharacterized glyoxalase superfamily protein PhnB